MTEYLLRDEITSTPDKIVSDNAIRIINGQYTWTSAVSGQEVHEKQPSAGLSNSAEDLPESNEQIVMEKIVDEESDTAASNEELVESERETQCSDFGLKDIDLTIPKGSLVAIIGAVGSGKSSLLSAIIGSMTKISGRIQVSGTIGYCSQTPWIQNATMKDNILFGQSYDQEKYQSVIRDCALEPDIKMLDGIIWSFLPIEKCLFIT
jgi:ABC-type transport system involved in cytochrome bd biosynthesis fused ATPase/permease subunit